MCDMTRRYKKKEAESGVRLMTLLQEKGPEILKREADNDHFIHLYCTGPYWVAFEKSAYLLHQIAPAALVTPMGFTTYPFPVVMVCWTDEELRAYCRNHLFHQVGDDYCRLAVTSLSISGFREWHRQVVSDLMVNAFC